MIASKIQGICKLQFIAVTACFIFCHSAVGLPGAGNWTVLFSEGVVLAGNRKLLPRSPITTHERNTISRNFPKNC
ncbi:MAG: hypothetical protein K6F95_06220, partial [Selenomonas sp.]|nr:hypothetical protein [Selenomonas sp.]